MKRVVRVLAGVLAAALLFGCAGTEEPVDPLSKPDTYAATGRGDSPIFALNSAKMDAVRQMVVDLIGAGAADASEALLQDVLYGTPNANQFVYNDSMIINRQEDLDMTGAIDMIYEIVITVNRGAVESVLRSNGLLDGGSAPAAAASGGTQSSGKDDPAPAQQPAAPAAEPEPADTAVQDGDYVEATPEEQQFLRRYVDSMTYMVYYDEQAIAESGKPQEEIDRTIFYLNAAVGQANRYLINNGFDAIDASQIEEVKADQRLMYEESTGQAVSLIQWIAQDLNADVYIQLETGELRGETSGDSHYGNANVILKMFEPSTGRLLGSQPFNSPRTMSRVDQFDAISNAIQASVFQAMPYITDQAQSLIAQSFARGVRFEVVIQNTPDARLMSTFRRRLEDRVSMVNVDSQTAEETKIEVFFFGRVEDLMDEIFDLTEGIPGLEYMDLVSIRGKNLTFTSGL